MSELKPCPFCGGKAVVKKRKTTMVSCTVCTASTFQRLDNNLTAITDWNQRKQSSREDFGDGDWWELFDRMIPAKYLNAVNAVNALPPEYRKYLISLLDIKPTSDEASL